MLKKYLLENWQKFIGTHAPDVLQIVPITSSLYKHGNDLVLLFSKKNSYPDYVMKMSRSPAYNFKLKNEFFALKSLKKIEKLSSYIPIPYYLGEIEGKTFFIQGGVRGGNSFEFALKNGTKGTGTIVHKAVTALIAINSENPKSDFSEPYLKEVSADILDQYGNDLMDHGINQASIDELKEACRYFSDIGHNYFLHGDYWPRNIMIDRDNITGVIDWEFSIPKSNIPTDICFFLISLSLCLHQKLGLKTNLLHAFKNTFFSKGEQNDLTKSCYRTYCEAFGLDKNLYNILMKITLTKMSMRELMTYGSHFENDFVYIELLTWFLKNESKSCFL